MARLILVKRERIQALLIVSQWEFDQILVLNAEAARIAGEELEELKVREGHRTALALQEHEQRTWRTDQADRHCRKGLSELLGSRILNEMTDRVVQIVVDKAPPGVNMAYDA